ncbi:MAG: class I SAM-dependent methyltransferase [Brucellaceae bacterium]|nr:class I SAM-dependent methyltransferase [Brucellaceae bacterium]
MSATRTGQECILDLCCGHGIVAAGLCRRVPRSRRLDFARHASVAREMVPEAEFVKATPWHCSFPDASFDGVRDGRNAPCPEPAAAMREARQVMKPGPYLSHSVWQEVEISAFTYVSGQYRCAWRTRNNTCGTGRQRLCGPLRAYPAMEAAGFGDLSSQVRWTAAGS